VVLPVVPRFDLERDYRLEPELMFFREKTPCDVTQQPGCGMLGIIPTTEHVPYLSKDELG